MGKRGVTVIINLMIAFQQDSRIGYRPSWISTPSTYATALVSCLQRVVDSGWKKERNCLCGQ